MMSVKLEKTLKYLTMQESLRHECPIGLLCKGIS